MASLRFFGNWKIKDDKIIISEGAYLEEGATGLASLVGELSKEDSAFIYERYLSKWNFDELVKIVKENSDTKKLYNKLVKIEKDKYKRNEIAIDELAKKMLEIKKMVYFEN